VGEGEEGGEERIAKVCFIWMRTILAGQYWDDPKSCCARAQTTVPRVRLKPGLTIVSGWPVTRSPSCRVVLLSCFFGSYPYRPIRPDKSDHL
jgi:hypothetical protein